MKLKKLFIISLSSLLCAASLSACGQGSENSEASGAESEISVEESSEPEKVYPEYWGYHDYEITETVGAPEEIISYETKITRKPKASSGGRVSEYLFECVTDAGTLYTTFHETKWGTFNLGQLYLVDEKGKKHVFTDGSTDWEYVHTPNAPSSLWSGGNHGNEDMVSLEFYNGETGEKLELADNESVTVNILHIIEKTKLLSLPNPTSVREDISGYTEADVYANVTRKYTVTGPQIKLNVDYEYVRDIAFSRSYTCMFPIHKNYGLTCEMYNLKGEMINKIVTPKENSNFNGNLNGGNTATRALIYGEADPRYQFDVRINTVKDSTNNFVGDCQTAFWDMNANNKLYFARFSNSSKTAFKAGDESHTECIWLFKFVPDAE